MLERTTSTCRAAWPAVAALTLFVAPAIAPAQGPPIGSSVSLASTIGGSLQDPDVAFDATTGRFLVVWRHSGMFSGGISASLVTTDGTVAGSSIGIENSSTASHARVANVDLRDAFVVVFHDGGDIYARTVDAVTGTVSARFAVAGGGDTQSAPDVGGEATTTDDDAIAVWWNETKQKIEARQLSINTTLKIALGPVVDVVAAGPLDVPALPAISKTGGPSGRHLVVWERRWRTAQKTDVVGAVVDRNLGLLDRGVRIATTSGDETTPDVDGDGTEWLVAYRLQDGIASHTVSFDLKSRNGTAGPQGWVTTDGYGAAVAWLGDSCLVGFTRVSPTTSKVFLVSIDPYDCSDCENGWVLAGGSPGNFPDSAAVAARHDSHRNEDGALAAWHTWTIGGLGQQGISAQAFLAEDGRTSDLGGGCGRGGSTRATCAREGHYEFDVRLRGAAPSSPAFLVLGFDRIDYGCEKCVLVPSPFAGFVVGPTTTDAAGHTGIGIPIPWASPLVGARFLAQWALAPASGTPACSAFGLDFSNAIDVQIQ